MSLKEFKIAEVKRFLIIISFILLGWLNTLNAQFTGDFNHFDYHSIFCKNDIDAQQIKLKKRLQFKKFDPIKYYAGKLIEEGLVSYQDTISNYLNFQLNELKRKSPKFNFRVAMIKSAHSGFLSISKDWIYIYLGTIAQLQTDAQLINLLYIIAENHARSENYAMSQLKISSLPLSIFERPSISNSINTIDFDRAQTNFIQDLYHREDAIPIQAFLNISEWKIDSNYFQPSKKIFKLDGANNQINFLVTIGIYTQISILYQEGRYDESIYAIQQAINSNSDFTIRLLLKNLYMKTYQMVYFPYQTMHITNVFRPSQPFLSNVYFNDLYTFIHYIYEMKPHLSSDILGEVFKLEFIYLHNYSSNREYNNWDGHAQLDTISSISLIRKKASTLSILAPSTNDLPNKDLESILYIEKMNLNIHASKPSVVIVPPELFYVHTTTQPISMKQYFLEEKRKLHHFAPAIHRSYKHVIEQSKYYKSYTTNTKFLKHGDICRQLMEVQQAGLQSSYISSLNNEHDSIYASHQIKYLVYTSVFVYQKKQTPWLRQFLFANNLLTFTDKKQILIAIDVYDIDKKKYIITSRRMIEQKGNDYISSNCYDIIKSILP